MPNYIFNFGVHFCNGQFTYPPADKFHHKYLSIANPAFTTEVIEDFQQRGTKGVEAVESRPWQPFVLDLFPEDSNAVQFRRIGGRNQTQTPLPKFSGPGITPRLVE